MPTHLAPGQLVPELGALALDGLRQGQALLDFGAPDGAMADEDVARRVHDTRRKLKWLRSMLRALRPALGEPTFATENRALRDAGRHLAAARSRMARRDCLLRLLGHFGVPASPARHPLLASGTEATLLSTEDREQAVELMRAVAERASEWLPSGGAALLRTGLAQELERARRAFRRAERAPTSHRVHEWRKHVKHHLHQLELVSELEPELGERIASLDALSELLGEAHDVADLRETLASASRGIDLRALCDSREAELTLRALTQGRPLFALRPRELRALLERRVRDTRA